MSWYLGVKMGVSARDLSGYITDGNIPYGRAGSCLHRESG